MNDVQVSGDVWWFQNVCKFFDSQLRAEAHGVQSTKRRRLERCFVTSKARPETARICLVLWAGKTAMGKNKHSSCPRGVYRPMGWTFTGMAVAFITRSGIF